MTDDVDVAVVGAGPAGCAAAITLAQRGRRVLLVDRAHFPRAKCCGDGLTTGALRRLEALGLDPGAVASFRPATELSVRSPSGRTVRLPLKGAPGTFAAVARRSDLDAALVVLTRRQGARFRDGTRCVGAADGRAGCVRLIFDDASAVQARFVIAADGAWSPLRRILAQRGEPGPAEVGGPPRPEWTALRTYASPIRPAAMERLWVWFAADLLPGYGWSFPLADGTANIGICVRRGPGPALATLWESTLASPFVTSLLGPDAVLQAPARAWPIPTGIDRVPLSGLGGRVLFAGDAACAADPFTGEGVGQALATGTLAAQAITEASPSPGAVANRYRAGVRRSLGRDHHLSDWCRALFSTTLGARGALRVVDGSDLVRRNVGRWLFEDYPRAIAVTPRHWAALARRSPGAFAGPDTE
ncbi:MAG TPA: NAD(P)/FAD-dependent oxidoreductase [Acidimicrobiales bacterium]|nr:NAD(P)/FAD-dependent oxidoreductase [Acidimicrobiales bacterium]